MNIEIQKKPPKQYEGNVRIGGTDDVLNLKEIQEIRDATQEHLLFLGLDNSNNLRTLNLIGVGSSSGIFVNTKDVLRTALLTASDKVILVHNHPSNSLRSSMQDKEISNKLYKFLSIFNIQLLDHIIVTEENYISMMNLKEIDKDYKSLDTSFVENVLLLEENNRLKKELEDINSQMQSESSEFEEDMEL